MNAIAQNDSIILMNPTPQLEKMLRKELTYTDKAKQYQLKRMAHNPFSRNSPLYKKLQSQVNGCLLDNDANGNLLVPSGMFAFLEENGVSIQDSRKETGTIVPLPWIKKPHDLRDYQEEAVALMEANYRGVINFATGLGKTLVATHLIKRYRRRALVVCPSESVASQFYDELEAAFGKNKIGYYGDGTKKLGDITIGIAASISKDIDKVAKHNFGLVIIDECHHTPATTFFNIAKGLAYVGKMFGLTATDFRSDGKDVLITAGCGHVLIRRDIKWGVENKWLAAPYFIVRTVDTSAQEEFKEDKLKNYKSHVLNCDVMKDQIRADIQKFLAAGKSVLCLVDEVAHGQELADQLGIPFATGKDKQSQEYVNQLNKGKIPGLIGTDGKVGEGTDTKRVDVLVLANFVASKGPVIQAIGRGLRRYPGKDICFILDYIPAGSKMLSRHAMGRIGYFREITDKVKII